MSQEQAHALQDAKTSNDFMRAAAQAAILINGGAATALLAFLGSNAASRLPAYATPVSLMLYAGGVFLAALSLVAGSKAIEKWMISHMSPARSKQEFADKADRAWKYQTTAPIIASLILFAISSAQLAVALIQAH
jgi:hypothetical protein